MEGFIKVGDITVARLDPRGPFILCRVSEGGSGKGQVIGNDATKEGALRKACQEAVGHHVWIFKDGTDEYSEHTCPSAVGS